MHFMKPKSVIKPNNVYNMCVMHVSNYVYNMYIILPYIKRKAICIKGFSF